MKQPEIQENNPQRQPALADATGYALRLACPDCGADKWKTAPGINCNECCVCAGVYHRHNIYSTSYLLGYHRGLKAHNAEL